MTEPKCPLCRGTMIEGPTDLTLRRDRSVVVVEAVPALVRRSCGEASLSAQVAQSVYALADCEAARGVATEPARRLADLPHHVRQIRPGAIPHGVRGRCPCDTVAEHTRIDQAFLDKHAHEGKVFVAVGPPVG